MPTLLHTRDGLRLDLLDDAPVVGGEAAIYAAVDTAGRRLAVKVAHHPGPAGSWLLDEGAVLQSLAHTSAGADVLPTLGSGTWNDRPFLVFPWIPHTLEAWTRAGPTRAERRRMAAALCHAVARIHGTDPRVVHRDLKPSNVLIDPDGRPIVADFGAARRPDPGQTTTTLSVFTAGYAPPEQVLPGPQRAERSTDLFGLAATVFHVLTGQAPGSARQNAGRLTADGVRRVRTGADLPLDACYDWPRMRALEPTDALALARAGATRPLRRELSAMLAPHPRDRRGSATQLAEVLERGPDRRPLLLVACTGGALAIAAAFALLPTPPPSVPTARLPTDPPVELGTTEVSQALWTAVMGDDPTQRRRSDNQGLGARCDTHEGVSLRGPDLPVVCVDFADVVAFANRLSARAGLRPAYAVRAEPGDRNPTVTWDQSADGWRLPTAAEWELGARAGATGRWPTEASADLCVHGNVGDARLLQRFPKAAQTAPCDDGYTGPSPVGHFLPNPLGIYDALGNASEWTWDASGDQRLSRGGNWSVGPAFGGFDTGGALPPETRAVTLGFRLARSAR